MTVNNYEKFLRNTINHEAPKSVREDVIKGLKREFLKLDEDAIFTILTEILVQKQINEEIENEISAK